MDPKIYTQFFRAGFIEGLDKWPDKTPRVVTMLFNAADINHAYELAPIAREIFPFFPESNDDDAYTLCRTSAFNRCRIYTPVKNGSSALIMELKEPTHQLKKYLIERGGNYIYFEGSALLCKPSIPSCLPHDDFFSWVHPEHGNVIINAPDEAMAARCLEGFFPKEIISVEKCDVGKVFVSTKETRPFYMLATVEGEVVLGNGQILTGGSIYHYSKELVSFLRSHAKIRKDDYCVTGASKPNGMANE